MTASCSVIIPTYNDAEYLKESVPGVLEQDYPGDLEIVIVDDGSQPPASQVYAPDDDHVRIIRQENAGVSAARNAGMAEARGDILIFLDADDLMLPGRITAQIRVLESAPEVGLVGADITRENMEGARDSWGIIEAFGADIPRCDLPAAGKDALVFAPEFRDLLLYHYPFNTSVIALRRTLIEQGIRFDASLPCWEDWDFVLCAAQEWQVGYVRRPLTLYRKRAGSITTTPDPRKFEGRARMFERWRAEYAPAHERSRMQGKVRKAWRAAAYEWRGIDRGRAIACALRAWKSAPTCPDYLRALAGALMGR